MSASEAREKGNSDADMPEMRVEIGREVDFFHSSRPQFNAGSK